MAKTFEQCMKELEEMADKLESGETTLNEAVKLFEAGMKLSDSCRRMLENAEKKVSVLLKTDDGEYEKQAFLTDEESKENE